MPKNLANLNPRGKNFGDVFFDVFRWPEFESEVRIFLEILLCGLCLSATVPVLRYGSQPYAKPKAILPTSQTSAMKAEAALQQARPIPWQITSRAQ
jgi:hypothetical protein